MRPSLDHEPTEPGWWLASDSRWHPPESAPGVVEVVLNRSQYEGGHPGLSENPLWGQLHFSSWGFFMCFPNGAVASSAIPMNLVASVEIGGQEVANSKLSAVLLFGVLGGLGAKGSKSQATVIVRTTDGNAAYFTLDELTAVQARAKLAPVLRKARVPFSDEIQTGGAATTGPALDIAGRLRELAALRDDGILTEDEFAAQKARLLDE